MHLSTATLSAAALRICHVRQGEVEDTLSSGRRVSPGAVPIGTIACASWHPSQRRTLGVLYTSGTLRLWDTDSGDTKDYGIYVPASGLPESTRDLAASGRVACRRTAAPMSSFCFLPATNGDASSSITFTVKRSKKLYFSNLAAVQPIIIDAATAAGAAPPPDHFLTGARVYEAPTALPAAPTALAAWRTTIPAPTATARAPITVIAVGCEDGSLVAWGLATAFNPEPLTGMRTVREASPMLVRLAHARHLASPDGAPGATAGGRVVGGDTAPMASEIVLSEGRGPIHKGRVRVLRPLTSAAADGTACFISGGDDGRVHIWSIAPGSAASGAARQLVVRRMSELPADGVPITAATSVPWPWRDSTPDAAALWAASGQPPERFVLATGNKEGVVCFWQLLLPARGTAPNTFATGRGADDTAPRLIAMISTASVDPVAAIAIAAPSSTLPNDQYSAAIASTDGTLQVYRLRGSKISPTVAGIVHDAGGAGPISVELQGTAGLATPAHAAHEVLRAMQPEATLVRHLMTAGIGERRDSGSVDAASSSGNHISTSALTALALQQLRLSFVACAFDEGEDAADDGVNPLLMACTAGGEILLWPRHQIPGTTPPAATPETTHGAYENEDSQASRGEPAPATPQKPRSEHGDAATGGDSSDGAHQAVAACQAEEIEPASSAESSQPPHIQVPPLPTSAIVDSQDDDDDDVPQPRAASVPPPSRPLPRVLAPTASSIARAQAAVQTLHDAQARRPKTSSERPVGGVSDRSFLKLAAMDAVRAALGSQGSSRSRSPRRAGHAPYGDASVATDAGHGPGASCSRHRRGVSGSPVDRLHARVASQLQRDADAASVSASVSANRGRAPRSSRASSRDGSEGASSRGGTHATGGPAGFKLGQLDVTQAGASSVTFTEAGRSVRHHRRGVADVEIEGTDRADTTPLTTRLEPSYRNPARVAAAVMQDAVRTSRAASLSSRAAAGAPDADVDDSIAVGGAGVTAPVLGSSAAIAAEIARLEAASFNRRAELDAILRRRRVHDAWVIGVLHRRVDEHQPLNVLEAHAAFGTAAAEHGQPAEALEHDAEPLLPEDMLPPPPVDNGDAAAPAGGSPGTARTSCAGKRRGLAVPLPRTKPAETVTAADALRWPAKLRDSAPAVTDARRPAAVSGKATGVPAVPPTVHHNAPRVRRAADAVARLGTIDFTPFPTSRGRSDA